MHSENQPVGLGRPVIAALTCALTAVVWLTCTHERANPLDPGSDNYVGDQSAYDRTAPALVVSSPVDASTVDGDRIEVRGLVTDAGGVKSVTVNEQAATVEGDVWYATVPLQIGTNSIAVKATDNSYHANTSTQAIVVTRAAVPRAPSGVSAVLQGTGIQVSWTDNSTNETGFVVERSQGTDAAYVPVDTLAADGVVFDDLSAFAAFQKYYYRVVAINSAGSSAPSSHDVIIYEQTLSDTSGPVVSILFPAQGAVLIQAEVDVRVTAADPGSGVASVTINGASAIREGETWSSRVTLTAGGNTVTIVAVDANPSANSTTVTLDVSHDPRAQDTEGPVVTYLSPAAASAEVASASLTVRLRLADPSGVKSVTLDGTAMVLASGTASSGVYSRAVGPLSPGETALALVATDSLDNPTVDTLKLTYTPGATDTVRPDITVYEPLPNARIAAMSVLVRGEAHDDISGVQSVMVNDRSATYDATTAQWELVLPLAHGANTITVSARDASPAGNTATRDITVVQNRPPRFSTLVENIPGSVVVGEVYTVTLAAEDPDGDAMVYQWVRAPKLAAAVLTTDAMIMDYAPNVTSAQLDSFSVLVKDDFGGADTIPWVVLVSPPTAQDMPPEVTGKPGDAGIPAGEFYTARVTAADPESKALTYTLSQGPAGMTVDGGGNVRWTPQSSQVHAHPVTITISDGVNSVVARWTLTVTAGNPPLVFVCPKDTFVYENQTLAFDVAIENFETGVKLDRTPIMAPAGSPGFQDVSSGSRFAFSWQPTCTYQGDYVFSAVFYNPGTPERYDTVRIAIVVRDVNAPPIFSMTPPLKGLAALNVVHKDTIRVIDCDKDKLTVTRLAGPADLVAWMITGKDSAAIEWRPTVTGIHPFSLLLDDGRGGTDTLNWQIQVRDMSLITGWVRLTGGPPLGTSDSVLSFAVANDGGFFYVGTTTRLYGYDAYATLRRWNTVTSVPGGRVTAVAMGERDEPFVSITELSGKAGVWAPQGRLTEWVNVYTGSVTNGLVYVPERNATLACTEVSPGVQIFDGSKFVPWVSGTVSGVLDVAFDPVARLYYAGTFKSGLYMSDDKAIDRKWIVSGSTLPGSGPCHAVAVDYQSNVFAARGAGGVYMGIQGGRGWSVVPGLPTTRRATDIAVSGSGQLVAGYIDLSASVRSSDGTVKEMTAGTTAVTSIVKLHVTPDGVLYGVQAGTGDLYRATR